MTQTITTTKTAPVSIEGDMDGDGLRIASAIGEAIDDAKELAGAVQAIDEIHISFDDVVTIGSGVAMRCAIVEVTTRPL